MKQESLLTVENLTIGFSGNGRLEEVVSGISFLIQPGETLGLVGESGSGKSMTAMALLQLMPAGAMASGSALFYNKAAKPIDLLAADHETIRRIRGKEISMVFQEPFSSFNPVFTCGEQIKETIENHGLAIGKQAKKLSLDWLAKVGLEHPSRIYSSYPHQVSGGQLQRVMIAMALCTEPLLLIADEPTTALDVHIQMRILELLNDLNKELNLSMLFISHDLGLIPQIADRVAIIDHGLLIEENDVNTLFSCPSQERTRQLLDSRPPIDRKLHRLPCPDNGSVVAPKPEPEIKAFPQEAILEVSNLKIVYKSGVGWFRKKEFTTAVKGISFTLYRGETLGIAGASGSGKTSLGRSLVKLTEPEEGNVLLHDTPQSSIQYIFQDPWNALNPTLEVGEAIREVIAARKPQMPQEFLRKEAIDYMRMVGLMPDYYYRYPAEFSGGQRQRISIARALAAEPKILICDEIVSALDVSIQAQVLNLLKDLQVALGLSYIFISHDLAVLRYMSDRLMVMKDGEVVETGASEAVFQSPSQDYTKELLKAVS